MNLFVKIREYEDATNCLEYDMPLIVEEGTTNKTLGNYMISSMVSKGKEFREICLMLEANNETNQRVSLCLLSKLDDWDKDNYIMVPAAVYNGNKFDVLKMNYPPIPHEKEYHQLDSHTMITDIPRLYKEAQDSILSLRAGDSSTPAVCLLDKKNNMGYIYLYEQGSSTCENGIVINEYLEEGNSKLHLEIQAPIIRRNGAYRFGGRDTFIDCPDEAATLKKGEKLTLKIREYTFKCETIQGVFDKFYELRQKVEKNSIYQDEVPFSKAFELIEDKYNHYNWYPEHDFYCVGERTSFYAYWQTGWVGGINAAYPLYMDGSKETKDRAIATMEYMFKKVQAPKGLFYGVSDGEKLYGDDFLDVNNKDFILIRKNADALYFATTIMLNMKRKNEAILEEFDQGLKKCADAFVELWSKYNQFGQFVDVSDNSIIVGGSTSGVMAIAGLALYATYVDDNSYLDVAQQAADYYYEKYVSIGLTNGGPGEILSAPDSESSYAMLESFVTLYEITRNEKFLTYGEDMAKQYATWCMSYDYEFPKKSQFSIHNMRTTGSVWANVQNKHSAPGVCTHSGSALFRLYLYTKNISYLNLCRDTSHNITQYVSTEDRAIYDYSGKIKAPSGFVCERVSTSDWEGFDRIGGIWVGGCWCEVTTLCVYTDIPGIYINKREKFLMKLDHIDCELIEENNNLVLKMTNQTQYDADVKIFIDEYDTTPINYIEKLKTIHVKSSETLQILL